MSYGRFRRDPCGNLQASPTYCKRCFRVYQADARERAMVHTCPACIERVLALPVEKERAS